MMSPSASRKAFWTEPLTSILPAALTTKLSWTLRPQPPIQEIRYCGFERNVSLYEENRLYHDLAGLEDDLAVDLGGELHTVLREYRPLPYRIGRSLPERAGEATLLVTVRPGMPSCAGILTAST